jgi:hypothetical protein
MACPHWAALLLVLLVLTGVSDSTTTVPPLLSLLEATPPHDAFRVRRVEGVERQLRATLVVEAAHGGRGRFAGHESMWHALGQHLSMDVHANVTVSRGNPNLAYGPLHAAFSACTARCHGCAASLHGRCVLR